MNTDTKQFTSASIKVAISDEIDSISLQKMLALEMGQTIIMEYLQFMLLD